MSGDLYCLVVAPFGRKRDTLGGEIDFDLVYQTLISPAIAAAGLEARRFDYEGPVGPMLPDAPVHAEVTSAPLALFDVTTGSPSVLLQLGLRYGAASSSPTVLVGARGTARIPFDLAQSQLTMYELNASGRPEHVDEFVRALSQALTRARTIAPVARDISVASAQARSTSSSIQAEAFKRRIQEARRFGPDELRDLEKELVDVASAPHDVVSTLFDAYRYTGAWMNMIELAARMHPSLRDSVRVREQVALALNRVGRWSEAEQTVLDVLRTAGPSSETYGILGRVYKDQYFQLQSENPGAAAKYLDKAIDAYLRGFETDWRDPYPGINAVTLMELRDPPDARREEILPVVRYAVDRRLALGREVRAADYWDHATRLEIAVLAKDERRAREALGATLAALRAQWEGETTANNLRLIRKARERRGEASAWEMEIEKTLVASVP